MQCIEGIENATIYAQLTISVANSNQTIHEIYIPIENCVWKRSEPEVLEYVVYAFTVPVLSCFGLCANFINAIVFMRPKMTPSAFTYLAALAWLDCFSCLLILLTALSRSIFYNSLFWMTYDFQWQTPLFGISTGASNFMLASVSCDRWIYLKHGIANGRGPPRLCRRKVARRVTVVIIIISLIVNIPYFFIFVVNNDGTFQAHKLYYSTFYKVHNWTSFILLTLLPAFLLVIGNIAIILAFRRWTKQSKKFQRNGIDNSGTTQKRYQHQMKLTITIIILIILYMVGELPAAMTSRKCVLNLLFRGDVARMDFVLISHMEMIFLTLNALQLSLNIIVYAVINPCFMPEFFACLRGASDACCNILCLTPLIRCMRMYCNKPKIPKRQSVKDGVILACERQQGASNVCEYESEQMEARNSVRRGSEVSNGSGTANWDTEPEEGAGALVFNLFYYWRNSTKTQGTPNQTRLSSEHDRPVSGQVWSTGMTWKRSSKFDAQAVTNMALQGGAGSEQKPHDCLVECEEVDENNLCDGNIVMKKRTKRHSLAF